MTSQILVLNKKRSFCLSDSTVTINDCKTYHGQQKIFKISDRLSCVAIVSGSGSLHGQRIKDLIDEYVKKTNIEDITTIEEIKDTLSEHISKATEKVRISDYVNYNFTWFKLKIESLTIRFPQKDKFIEFLKSKPSYNNIEFLENNRLLNQLISNCANSLFPATDKNEYDELKFYLRKEFYNFLINNSPNIALVGYDEIRENPTFFKYVILCNSVEGTKIVDRYSIEDCNSTMILTMAQDEDIKLSLMGFNESSYRNIRKIFLELLNKYFKGYDDEIIYSIDEFLKNKLDELKLDNIETIMEYIKILPDSEILKLFEILIELTSVKKKFSNESHSVGGNILKVILRKYDGIKFVE